METRQFILFVALAFVLLLIWQNWQQYQQAKNPPPTVAAGQLAPAAQGGGESGAPPVATPGVTPGAAGEIPAAPAGPAAAPVAAQATESGEVIDVTTDLFHAQIDPLGGDLVRVELLAHPVSVDTPEEPFVLMQRSPAEVFIAQSGLIGREGHTYPTHKTHYSAAQQEYKLGDSDQQLEVGLDWTAPDGVKYRKIYRFRRDSYHIDVDFQVSNPTESDWNGYFYGQLQRTEPVAQGGYFGRLPSYTGATIYTPAEHYEKIDFGDMREQDLNRPTASGWVAMLQHYFFGAWLPSGAESYQLYSGVSQGAGLPLYRIGYKNATPTMVPAGSEGVVHSGLFVGPKEQDRLDAMEVEGLKLVVDYGWLTPVANPLFWLLNNIHSMVGNWGWAIILLTVLVKLVFFPLSAASYKSMAKMRKLQPRLTTLKERYGDDKQKFQQQMMEVYKKEKVNPAGGCLPILVQIPVFIALYWVLLESVELRQADFMLWLKDLSLPDPFYVLPLIMGASMLAQHFLNPAPIDPLQKKIMLAMPIVFTVFFLWFPAGLVLYWVVNNLLSISQQYFITKKYAS